MAKCDVQDLVAVGNCFACIPPGTQQLVKLSLLCQILKALDPMAVCHIESLIASAQCFQCLPPGMQSLVELSLLCEILHAGGSSGQVCLLTGSGAPVGTPPAGCAAAIYFDSDYNSPTVGSFWWGDNINLQWNIFIST